MSSMMHAAAQTSGEPLHRQLTKKEQRTHCSRCLYDETTPAIRFDEQGVCNYCHLHDQLDAQYPTGPEGEQYLHDLARRIKASGGRKKYDVVVGVSGGCDSSMLVWKAKQLGLRPLAAHFDNTWNSTTATENIHNVLRRLGVDLFTYVVDNEEYDDIYRSFLLAGLPDIDAATDIGLATTLYMACAKYGIKYIFEGHSFRTEGVSPLGWCYMDAKYIANVHKQFGTRKMKTFPNLWLLRFLRYTAIHRIKKIRPLYYMDYHKEQAKEFLTKNLGWKWYGGHHLENRWSHFSHSYFFPRRYHIDQRLNGYSALVRSRQMTRDEGLRAMAQPPHWDPEIIGLVKKRLNLSDAEFDRLMKLPHRTYRDFKTYKPAFERLRPLFWLLYKMDAVPKSFYIKYTSKSSI